MSPRSTSSNATSNSGEQLYTFAGLALGPLAISGVLISALPPRRLR